MAEAVRVRIGPSPTGDPHVGLAYTTLFNYAYAKANGGAFIFRLEDTDQSRAKASSARLIASSLKWLGFEWDEGPDVGGPYGPYRQSERTPIYQEHAEILLNKGAAYRCFCTPERLQKLREDQRKSGGRFGYDGHCRNLAPEETQRLMDSGQSFVVRLKMPTEGKTVVNDLLRGPVEFDNQQSDDQVLLKSDGFPTYHLANVVDDHLMKISHVIRAEEWINSTPKHLALYEAFGWQPPKFAHLPLLRNPDKSKISKRKNPVSLNYYRRKGILPQAMVNFLGLMGWSYEEGVETFSLAQMIDRFKLEDITLGGPVFDIEKLTWLNQQYVQRLSEEEFVSQVREEVFNAEKIRALFPLFKERVACFEEFVDKASFCFNGALNYKDVPLVPKGKEASDLRKMLRTLVEQFDELYTWDAASVKSVMDNLRSELEWKPRDFYMPIRLVVTGRKDSPPLEDSVAVVGREMVRFRIRNAIEFLK